MKHSGPALVFDDYASMKKAVDDEDLDVTADHVLVLRNAGPQGGPGMPEWGMLPMPKKLLKEGHRDMLRLSDARMSGTSYGACVLHVAPESFVGGPLGAVENWGYCQHRCRCADASTWRSLRRNSHGAVPSGSSLRHVSSGAMAGCIPSIFSKPTKVVISTSCVRNSVRRIRSLRFIKG